MICPICQIDLISFQEADLHLDHCPTGHGIWFDGGELATYRKEHPNSGNSEINGSTKFLSIPGTPVKDCPRCTTATLEGGRLYELDVRHCFTCHGVFLGQSLPMTQDPLDPTPVLIGTWVLQAIASGFG
ncbi:TFIIB-type zinc ribbon-containing protein [Candidatus Nitrospira salsa]